MALLNNWLRCHNTMPSRRWTVTQFSWQEVFYQLSQAILFFSLASPPPKFTHHTCHIITQCIWQFKDTHSICTDDLSHSFCKNFFSALDNSFSFHPESLLSSLSRSWWNVLHLFFPTREGRPRYCSCSLMISVPNLFFISSCVASVVLWLKNKDAFSWFNCCPKATS